MHGNVRAFRFRFRSNDPRDHGWRAWQAERGDHLLGAVQEATFIVSAIDPRMERALLRLLPNLSFYRTYASRYRPFTLQLELPLQPL